MTREILSLVPGSGPRTTSTAPERCSSSAARRVSPEPCRLAAAAAFRADAGYVAVAVPEASLPVVETRLLEPVKVTWAGAFDAAGKARALAIGPGLGRTSEAKRLRDELLTLGDHALVLDADGLHELEPGDWGRAPCSLPMRASWGGCSARTRKWVNTHRLDAARRGADRFGAVRLLKGADTIVAAPGGSDARVRHRRARPRDRGNGRRTHRDRRRLPRERRRATVRGGRRSDRAWARRPRLRPPPA